MGRKATFKKPQILEAIKSSNGIVSTVADRLKITWHAADAYIKKWPETQKAFQDETERVLDFAESKIMDSIRKGNTADAKWYLSKKGKARGFGDDAQPLLPFDEFDDELKVIIDDGNSEQ